MDTTKHRLPAQGVRALTVHLHQGTIQLSRVEGDELIVECAEGVAVERSGDRVVIRGGAGRGREGMQAKRRVDMEDNRSEDDSSPFGGPDLADLGTFINTVVGQAVNGIFRGDFPFGSSQGRVWVGVPVVLEMPRIEIQSSRGDLTVDGLKGEFVLHNHLGDIQVRDAGGTLEARSGKGDIEIKGFRGPVRAHSGMGDVELEECVEGGAVHTGSGDIEGRRLTGPWEMHTGSGDVSIEVDDSASFQVSTGSGDIELSGGYVDRLEARTGSGDVECTSILHGTRHNLITGSGDIRLAIANPPGARLQAITRMGSINSEFPLVMVGKQGPQSHGGSRYVGKIGDGTIDIELRTGAGDITINRRDSERPSRGTQREEATGTSPARDFSPAMPAPPPFDPVPSPSPTSPISPIPAMPPIIRAGEPAPFGQVGASRAEERYMNGKEPEPELAEDTGHEGEQPPENARLKVLESLQRGEITVEEASTLLRSLSVSV